MLGPHGRAREVCALNRILILGGYGGFGARLTRRLIDRGHCVVVAGRNLDRATAFCRELSGSAEPAVADRNGDLGPLLAKHSPDLVIDAAGPFQGSDHRVPLSCIKASIPYLDLADARAFVTGISALDKAARDAGVVVIVGASSVPALSGAVARTLAAGLDKVFSVEMAISASKRATVGASVVAAILSYAGRPVKLWRGQRWDHGFGWQELRRETFTLSDGSGLSGRWLAIADVPDLDLLPESLPGRPAVIFRAGTESALQTLGLWLLSWPVRWLGAPLPRRLAPVLLLLQRLTQTVSDDRSAMSVRLKGKVDDRFVERQWTLIASKGDGPEIPILAAVILTEAVMAGRIASGAHAADKLLKLDQFEPLFATLSLRHEMRERSLPPSLYRRVMGERYDALPEMVRKIHHVCGDSGASGEAVVTGGQNIFARLIAKVMRFPKAGACPLHVSFAEKDGVERWTRSFGDQSFASYLSEHDGRLVERFGALRFQFDLRSDDSGLEMHIRGWSILGVPLPLALAPQGNARSRCRWWVWLCTTPAGLRRGEATSSNRMTYPARFPATVRPSSGSPMEAEMRKYPYKLPVEDRQIVWGWCRRMLVGYVTFAIVLLLAALAFRADHDGRDYGADETLARFDRVGVDELAISAAPAPPAIHPNVVVEQKVLLKGAGVDQRRVP